MTGPVAVAMAGRRAGELLPRRGPLDGDGGGGHATPSNCALDREGGNTDQLRDNRWRQYGGCCGHPPLDSGDGHYARRRGEDDVKGDRAAGVVIAVAIERAHYLAGGRLRRGTRGG